MPTQDRVVALDGATLQIIGIATKRDACAAYRVGGYGRGAVIGADIAGDNGGSAGVADYRVKTPFAG
jgi:hypothetical protein